MSDEAPAIDAGYRRVHRLTPLLRFWSVILAVITVFLLQVNLENQVYAGYAGVDTVADYVSQTIVNSCINILCFLVCFVLLYLAVAIIVNALKAIFRFPVLKQLDWLAGGVFGFAGAFLDGIAAGPGVAGCGS